MDKPAHQVLNLPAFAERANSVNIYRRPCSTCEIYDPEKSTYENVTLRYSTEYGRLNSSA